MSCYMKRSRQYYFFTHMEKSFYINSITLCIIMIYIFFYDFIIVTIVHISIEYLENDAWESYQLLIPICSEYE